MIIANLAFIHVPLQHLVVRFNTRVLNIEVTCNPSKLSTVEVSTFFIEPHHFSFVQ